MPPSLSDTTTLKRTLLGDPRLRQELCAAVRRRVPADAVDDVVQATLVDAFASDHAPAAVEEFRRWLWGIARNKVADHHRKRRRERGDEVPELEAPADNTDEASALLRWAERELPEGPAARQTLGWLLREGEGEKLEHIAAEENLPAPRVRQRVTRLRQHFRARWQAQLAVAALVGVALAFGWWLRARRPPEAPIVRETPLLPSDAPLPAGSAPPSAAPLASEAPLPSPQPPPSTTASASSSAPPPPPPPTSSAPPRPTPPPTAKPTPRTNIPKKPAQKSGSWGSK